MLSGREQVENERVDRSRYCTARYDRLFIRIFPCSIVTTPVRRMQPPHISLKRPVRSHSINDDGAILIKKKSMNFRDEELGPILERTKGRKESSRAGWEN